MNIYYEVIGGSYCYNLNIETSDIDLCRVSDYPKDKIQRNGYHIIQITREDFLDRAILSHKQLINLQWLFPYKINKESNISEFILYNRENIVEASKKNVYDNYLQIANGLSLYAEHYYRIFPKRLAYSTLFYDTIVKYKNGYLFSDAIYATSHMRDLLIAMRKAELPVEEAIALNQDLQKNAIAAYDWYNKDIDTKYLKLIREKLYENLFYSLN